MGEILLREKAGKGEKHWLNYVLIIIISNNNCKMSIVPMSFS